MSAAEMKFSVNLAQDARFESGLRSYLEYRDLGIKDATHGQFKAHVFASKKVRITAICIPPGCIGMASIFR